MSKRRMIGLALVFGLALLGSGRQADAAPDGSAGAPDSVLRETLPNGLRVVIVPDRLAPVVATEMCYLAGSNDAPAGFPGTAHALEHMMFRGSAGLDKDQLAELGALLGGAYNADTTETATRFTYTVPAADLGLALRAEALRMRGLSLNQSDWETERGAIEQEVARDLSSPFYNYMAQAQAALFQGTPYEHDALGTRPSFDRTDAALLRGFYEKWYAPNNAILIIVGDVAPQAALAEARATFGDIPRRDVAPHGGFDLAPVAPKTLRLPTDFSVGVIALAYRFPGLRDRDFAAADVLGDVLGSERGPLYGLGPAGRALQAQFNFQAKADVGLAIAYAAFPSGGDPAPLLADIQRILGDARQGDIAPELVEAAKRQEIAQLAFQRDSIVGLARAWSRALAFQGAESPDDLAHAYAAVSVDDVKRLAHDLLDPDRVVTAFLTPRDSGHPVAGGGGFGGAESFSGAPDHPVELPDWAASALASLPKPPTFDAPDVSVLPNGLRLIVQPERVSPTVSVFGRVREVKETQEPRGKEGVAALTRALFEYGTTTRDRLALREAVDDIAARLDAGPGFSLRVLKEQFEPGLRLLAENELHPAFPAAGFLVARKQSAQTLFGELQSPDYLFERATTRAIVPPDDPMLREATPATVEALQLADVQAYYAAAYRPDLTTIVVVGDVTPELARRAVGDAFGGWRADGPTPSVDLPPVGPSGPSEVRVPDSSSVQDSVVLLESLPLPVTDPDRYPLLLGNEILGSNFSSRLYRDLRIRSGYVYSVGSELDWTRTRATYGVSFGADPENVEKARRLVARDITDMQTAPVSDAELTRAKAQTLRALPMQRSSVRGIAGLYLYLTELGLPLNAPDIAAARYVGITAFDIQRAFATWLRPDDLARVVKGPPLGP